MDKEKSKIIKMMIEELGVKETQIPVALGDVLAAAVQTELLKRAASRVADKLENNWEDE